MNEINELRERAEAAEAELLAVREDNHSMMLEIDGLRTERDRLAAELAKLREQEPMFLFRQPNGLQTSWIESDSEKQAECLRNMGFEVKRVFADPIPAHAAPSVPDGFRAAVTAYIAAVDRFHKLDSTVGGGWSTKMVGSHQQRTLAAAEMHGRRKLLDALLQSATSKDSGV